MSRRADAGKGVTVKEAGRIAGVGTSKIQAWRTGTQPTDFKAVRQLARALGTSFSFLLTGEDDTRPEGETPIAEVLKDGGMIFDGICQVTIKRLVPRAKAGGIDDDDP